MKFFFAICLIYIFQNLAQHPNNTIQIAKELIEESKDDSASVLLISLLKTKNLDYKKIAESNNLLGHIELNKGNLLTALKYYILVEKIAIENNDLEKKTASQINISGVYREQNNLLLAQKYIDDAATNLNSIKEPKILANFSNNKAILLEMKKEFSAAIEEYKKSLKIYESIADSNHIAITFNNLGLVYKNMGNLNEALSNYARVIEIEKKIGNKYILSATYINVGNLYFKQKNYALAEQNSLLGLNLAKIIPAKYLMVAVDENLADIYAAKKDFTKSIYYHKLRFEDNEKYLNEENSKQINSLQAQYETAKKDKEIQIQKFEIQKKNYWIFSILSLLLLTCLVAYTFYKRFKTRQELRLQTEILNQQTIATKGMLEAEEQEQRRIAGDLHDGVGQLMTAAWLNLQALKKSNYLADNESSELLNKSMKMVDEAVKEVRQVSHNMMPNSLSKKGLVSAISEFTMQFNPQIISIQLHIMNENIKLENHIEAVLYRIVQECVNNVLKHAKASRLDITIGEDASGIDVMIEDNGVGFDYKKKISESDGLGLNNIIRRVKYLKGVVDWESSPTIGTLVAIHIPKA